jgi:hypothetical protein
MGQIVLSGIPSFWRGIEDLREAIVQRGTACPELPDRIDRLAMALDQVPEPLATARRKALDALTRRYGIDLPPPEPVLVGDGPWPLTTLEAPARPGISLVTCCKNRNANLLRALPTWLDQPEIDEIVIVDWCSDTPVAEEIAAAGIADPRLRIARVEDEPRWILSYAFNLGFRLARRDRILKVDADIMLDPGFFARNPLPSQSFIAGNWRRAEQGQSFVNGFFYIHRADLMAENGFNEHITTYGWDDDELYERLEAADITRIDVAEGTIRHLDHDDEARIDERKEAGAETALTGWDDLHRGTMHRIRTNRLISTIMPRWDAHRILLPFNILAREGQTLVLQRHGWVPHPVPGHIRERAELLAAWEILSWKGGLRVWELAPEALERLLRLRRLDAIAPLHVEMILTGAPDAAIAAPRHLVADAAALEGTAARATLSAVATATGRLPVIRTESGTLPETLAADLPEGSAGLPLWAPIGTVAGIAPELLADAFAGRLSPALAGYDRPVLRFAADPRSPVPEQAMVEAGGTLAAPDHLVTRERLFVDAQHGLGNRLRAIGSGAAIAAATGREMVVVWEPDHHCEARLADLIDYDGAVIERCFPEAAQDDGQTFLNYMEIEAGAAKGAPLELVAGRDAYVRTAYVIAHPASTWETENRLLRRLVPAEPVLDLMARVPDHRDIALHIRMEGAPGTDQNSYDRRENWTEDGHRAINAWRSKSHYSHFLERLKPLLADRPDAQLFLAADLPETYAAMHEALGDRVAWLERRLYDRSAAQLQYALADLLLLARCRVLLGSNWSSFSEVALRLSSTITHHEMSGVDF